MVDTVKLLGALLGGGNMSSGSGANILKSVLGSALSGGTGTSQGGDLGELLGDVLKGNGNSGQGGLGDMLSSVLGGSGSSGGLGNILGSVLGGGQPSAGGGDLGSLLGGVLGGRPQGTSGAGGADLSELVGAALSQFGNSEKATRQGRSPINFETNSPDLDTGKVQDQAEIMIRAMINAAKSDGRVDKDEQQKILGQLGSLSQDEVDFVNNEIASKLDVDGFAGSVPQSMKNQVYTMSLMAIDLDNNTEANYLHQLGQSLGIQPETINQIHRQLGARVLYT